MNEVKRRGPAMQAPVYQRWFIWLLTAGIVCEFFFLYEDTFLWMKTAWFEYAPDRAGVLVPPLFLWMVYNRLKRRSKTFDESPALGYSVIFFSLAAFVLGRIVDINFLQALSMIGIGFGLVMIIGGLGLGIAFLFPFSFLILMIPSVSYLLESFAGALLRQAVLHGSAMMLNLLDGVWEMTPAGLVYNEHYLQIRFFRGGLSSVLLLLILNFAVAEGSVKREFRKFLFTALYAIFFVAAFTIHFIFFGWTIAADLTQLRSFIALNEWWIPALLFLFLMTVVRLFAWGATRKRELTKRG